MFEPAPKYENDCAILKENQKLKNCLLFLKWSILPVFAYGEI